MIRLFLMTAFIYAALQLAVSQRSCWVALRRLLSRVVVTAAMVMAMLLGLWTFAAANQPSATDGDAAQVDFDVASPVATLSPQATAETDEQPGAPEPAAGVANDTMVLLISGDDVQKLLGQDGANAVAGLEGLKRVYAMVPLPTTGAGAIPPALLDALDPDTLRHVLSPGAMQIIATALSQVIVSQRTEPPGVSGSLPAESDGTDEVVVAERPPHVLASWVSNPGVGQLVVKSEFLEATIDEEEALRESIVTALKEQVSRRAAKDFGANEDWQKLVDVSLTDQALRFCILSTDARTEVIESSAGSHPMQQTFALVEFPESMEQQVLNQIKVALRENRLVALCVTIGVLWLTAILFSAACRFSQGGSLLRNLATFPVMALLILPCMLICAFMVGAMIKGATFEFKSEDGRMTCVVDRGGK